MKRILRRVWVSAAFWSGVLAILITIFVICLEFIEALGLFLSWQQVASAPVAYLLVQLFSTVQSIALMIAGICSIRYSRLYKAEHFPKKVKPPIVLHQRLS